MWPVALSNLTIDRRLGRLLPHQLPKQHKLKHTAENFLYSYQQNSLFVFLDKNYPLFTKSVWYLIYFPHLYTLFLNNFF